jgi:hypothetical protein
MWVFGNPRNRFESSPYLARRLQTRLREGGCYETAAVNSRIRFIALCIVRGSGRVQAPDCGAPASPSDFAAGLIRLFLASAQNVLRRREILAIVKFWAKAIAQNFWMRADEVSVT